MAFENVPVLNILFSKDPRTKITGSDDLEDIDIDAVITRGTDFAASVTRAPVEDGTSINDHVVLEPVSLLIEGLVSDHPVGLLEGLGSAVQAAAELLGQETKTKSKRAVDALEKAWREKSLLKIETRRKTYDNMVIERITIAESAEIGDAIRFSMQLIEVVKVKLARVVADDLASIAGDLAQGDVDLGKKPAKPPPARVTQAFTSITQAANFS